MRRLLVLAFAALCIAVAFADEGTCASDIGRCDAARDLQVGLHAAWTPTSLAAEAAAWIKTVRWMAPFESDTRCVLTGPDCWRCRRVGLLGQDGGCGQ